MPSSKTFPPSRAIVATAAIAVLPFLAVGMFPARLYAVIGLSPYLAFHNVVELLSVVVSLSIFGVGWYSHGRSGDKHALFLGSAFLAIGLIDLFHALSYPGMPDFVTANSVNKASLYWIAVRGFGSLAFLASAFVRPDSKSRWLSKLPLACIAILASAACFAAVTFFPGALPAAYVAGAGQTAFKKGAEYAIIAILLLSIAGYWRLRRGELPLARYLEAFALCAFSEAAFAVYRSAYDSYNMLGHLYKAVAFLILYRGMFIETVLKPYDELRRSGGMLAHVIDAIPQAVFWKDRRSVYLGCNEVFARQADLRDPRELIGKDDFDLPWGAEASRGFRADDREVVDSGTAKYHVLERLPASGGRSIWVDTTKIPLRSPEGAVEGVLGVFEDVTERLRVQDELNEALAFNEQIINCARTGLVVADMLGRVRVWNPYMEELSGYAAADMMGKSAFEVIPFPKEARILERSKVVLSGGSDAPSMFEFSVPATGKSGWAEIGLSPLRSRTGQIIGAIASVKDCTQARRTEDQLRQSQKMEALGQLAGGVAHDFNNMLQVIIGYGSMLAQGASPAQMERIDGILASADRAAQLTSGLLSYSRKQVLRIESVDLCRYLGELEKFLRRIVGEDLELTIVHPGGPLVAAIDRVLAQQVFMNLAANARDAMPSGGKLVIGLEGIVADDAFAREHGLEAAGPHAVVSVSDTGTGISREDIGRIFEPFFTTKERGKGTGLGLAIVYGIVKQHKGSIICYSELGIGTTFKLYLPLTDRAVSRPEPRPRAAPARRDGLSVLIAEDDPSVREAARAMLEQGGIKVASASDGSEAVQAFLGSPDAFDLVILDVLMPRLSGVEALALMRQARPGVKALFMSGYAREIISGKMLLPDDSGFVGKPVTPERLFEAIDEALGAGPGIREES